MRDGDSAKQYFCDGNQLCAAVPDARKLNLHGCNTCTFLSCLALIKHAYSLSLELLLAHLLSIRLCVFLQTLDSFQQFTEAQSMVTGFWDWVAVAIDLEFGSIWYASIFYYTTYHKLRTLLYVHISPTLAVTGAAHMATKRRSTAVDAAAEGELQIRKIFLVSLPPHDIATNRVCKCPHNGG